MAKYIIHACPNRMWYVNSCLVPTMKQQGIKNIDIRCDDEYLGNLESCMKIFASMNDNDEGSWHLQDDVIICHNFKELTERHDSGIVCGFTSPRSANIGIVRVEQMWWSFPCIRIPDRIARECAEWYYSFAKNYAKYYEWVHMNKCDDNFFWEFMKQKYPDAEILNLTPNLVDHVDFVLGGSIVNTYRGNAQMRAAYFEDGYLVDNLVKELEENRNERS